MSSTLTGPAGGEWVHTTATLRDVPVRCDQCGAMVTTGIWQYVVGIVSHARVCDGCADINEEVTMEGTAGITPAILSEIALALDAAHEDWIGGRAASPDTADYVRIAEGIIGERVGPEYLWLAEGVTAESVAEALYEAQQDGVTLQTWPEMAEWLSGMVTVGPDADDFPSGERS